MNVIPAPAIIVVSMVGAVWFSVFNWVVGANIRKDEAPVWQAPCETGKITNDRSLVRAALVCDSRELIISSAAVIVAVAKGEISQVTCEEWRLRSITKGSEIVCVVNTPEPHEVQ